MPQAIYVVEQEVGNDLYNAYLTREKAERAVEIMKGRASEHYSTEELNKLFKIFEIKEGQGFGPGIFDDCDVFVEDDRPSS